MWIENRVIVCLCVCFSKAKMSQQRRLQRGHRGYHLPEDEFSPPVDAAMLTPEGAIESLATGQRRSLRRFPDIPWFFWAEDRESDTRFNREERARIEKEKQDQERLEREEENQRRVREESQIEEIEREKKMDVAAEKWVLKMEGKSADEAEKPSRDTLNEAERQSQEAEKELEAYLEHSPMSVSLSSLLEGVLARGPLISKPEPESKVASSAPKSVTTPKKRAMSPRSRVREWNRQATEDNIPGPSTSKTFGSFERGREREKIETEPKRAKGRSGTRSVTDYRCVDEYPIRTRGTMFGGLNRIPTDPNVDPPERVCFNCWKVGHPVKKCPQPQLRLFCHNCGRIGVDVWQCPRCGSRQRRMADERWKESKMAEIVPTVSPSPKPQSVPKREPVDRAGKKETDVQVNPSARPKEDDSEVPAEISTVTQVTTPTIEQLLKPLPIERMCQLLQVTTQTR